MCLLHISMQSLKYIKRKFILFAYIYIYYDCGSNCARRWDASDSSGSQHANTTPLPSIAAAKVGISADN